MYRTHLHVFDPKTNVPTKRCKMAFQLITFLVPSKTQNYHVFKETAVTNINHNKSKEHSYCGGEGCDARPLVPFRKL